MTDGVPPIVIAKALTLLSIKRFDWQVNQLTVPDETVVVKGAVPGVKLLVYKAPPLVILKLDI